MLIVGAGPAGSFLAFLLARKGISVVLADKAIFPRDKVCGGGITNKTQELLLAGGIDISPIIHRQLSGCFLSYRKRDTVVKRLGKRSGTTVLRSEFDHLLLTSARSEGADFREGCAFLDLEQHRDHVVALMSRGVAIQARYVIGADGAFSQVRRRLFGADSVECIPALEALVYSKREPELTYAATALFDFGAMPRGYAWVFPKKDHLNVGVFSPFGSRRIRKDLQCFINAYQTLRDHDRMELFGFCIPIRNRSQLFERDRVWLIGDAAGVAEAFYGEGIYHALRSAEEASAALERCLERPVPNLYTSRLKSAGILADLRYARLCAGLFYSFQRFGFYHLVHNPTINNLFAEVLAGRVRHRRCFYRTLALAPLWVPPYGVLGRSKRLGRGYGFETSRDFYLAEESAPV